MEVQAYSCLANNSGLESLPARIAEIGGMPQAFLTLGACHPQYIRSPKDGREDLIIGNETSALLAWNKESRSMRKAGLVWGCCEENPSLAVSYHCVVRG